MKRVGIKEARTHLSELIKLVEAGESITITRNGLPIAQLVPVREFYDSETPAEIVAAMRDIRNRVKGGGPSIREMIRKGRRF